MRVLRLDHSPSPCVPSLFSTLPFSHSDRVYMHTSPGSIPYPLIFHPQAAKDRAAAAKAASEKARAEAAAAAAAAAAAQVLWPHMLYSYCTEN